MTNDPNVTALLEEMGRLRVRDSEAVRAQEATPPRRVLGMYIGQELYGIGIDHITEIGKLPPVTFVPGAATFILGVTSLRGQIVPIVNMRLILGLAPETADGLRGSGGAPRLPPKPRIVVVHQNDVLAGLLVDSVTEVYDILVPLETPFGTPIRGYQIKEGWVQVSGQMVILLHVPTLFARLAET